MPSGLLLTSAGTSLLAGLVYTYVGWSFSRRTVQQPAVLAAMSFVTWWMALGAHTVITGVRSLLAAFGVVNLPLHFALNGLSTVLIPLSLLGLVFYLVFLFTGRTKALFVLIPLYTAVFLGLEYLSFAQGPIGVSVGRWSSQLIYENPATGGPLHLVLVAVLLLPQILGAIAYLSLATRVDDRGQRFRIIAVSSSMLIWMGTALFVGVGGLAASDWWQLSARFIGLAAAVMILAVYSPPAFMRRRFGLDGSAPDVR